jgi:uncharacterized membrane protein
MDYADGFVMSKELLAALTGGFTALSLALFLRGFLKSKTRPYLWAWLVRLAICIVAFFGQMSQGATYSLALAASQIFCATCIIGCIVYAKPKMGKLDTVDWAALGVASAGVVLWIASGNSLYSILGVIIADSCATAMSIRAAIQKGSRESIAFWSCALAAATMATLAAKGSSWAILLAPLFSCLNAAANISASLFSTKKHRRSLPQPQPLTALAKQ